MAQTVEYWRPTTGNYHDQRPGIAVLTNDTNWHELNMDTGMYVAAPFPAGFRNQVRDALTYINRTPSGSQVLNGIMWSHHQVDITPTSLGNNVQSVNQPQAVNRVAQELLANGIPGANVAAAFGQLEVAPNVRAAWLGQAINTSPRWSLDRLPGLGRGFKAWLQSVRQYVNTWLLWSDSNEGYFRSQTLGRPWGVGAYNIGITTNEVQAWLNGNPLPPRLNQPPQQHAILATIVALRDGAPRNNGSSAHVRWNPSDNNPLNARRPPAIGLGHELIHAYFTCLGAQYGYDDGHYSTVLFEYRCVGLGPWDEFPQSENALRREWWTHAVPYIPVNDRRNRKAPPKRIKYD